jgi:hypothetical protein
MIEEDALLARFGALAIVVSQVHTAIRNTRRLTGTWGAVCHIHGGILYSVCMQAGSDGRQHPHDGPGGQARGPTCMRASRFSVPVAAWDAMGGMAGSGETRRSAK